MGINDLNQQKALKEFANDSSKNELKIESHQKEFLSKIVGAVGTTGSSTNPGGASGTFTKAGLA